MDFRLTEEQQQLKEAARRFARERLVEVAKHLEHAGEPAAARDGEVCVRHRMTGQPRWPVL